MWERRPMFGALIGLTLCFSLWSLALQGAPNITDLQQSTQSQQPQLQQQTQQLQNPTAQFLSTVITQNHNNVTMSSSLYSSNGGGGGSISSSSSNSFSQTHTLPLELLEENDFSRLIDLNDFRFLINQKSCSKLQIKPLVLIFIHSAPNNLDKRNLIRETWGRHETRSRLYFFVGAVNTTAQQTILDDENHKYGDLIQGNFHDAYRNMTYKHIMVLKWFTYYCPEAKYILKADDDVFVNTPKVYDYLEADAQNRVDNGRRELLFCVPVREPRVYRTYRSKWRVTAKEYPARFYPDYCPGFSIIYSRDTAFQLYRAGQTAPYFWIDDVHVTGTLAKQIGVKITPLGKLYLKWPELNDRITKFKEGNLDPSLMDFLFVSPNLQPAFVKLVWEAVQSEL